MLSATDNRSSFVANIPESRIGALAAVVSGDRHHTDHSQSDDHSWCVHVKCSFIDDHDHCDHSWIKVIALGAIRSDAAPVTIIIREGWTWTHLRAFVVKSTRVPGFGVRGVKPILLMPGF